MSRVNPAGTRAVGILALLAGIAALHLARDLLIPAALAVLLTFLLNPLVGRLQRWGLPRVVGVIASVGVMAIVTGTVGTMVVHEATELTKRLPDYRENLRQKVREVRSSIGRINVTLSELKELSSTQPTTAIAGVQPAVEPVKVEVIDSGPGFSEIASTVAVPLLYPLGQIAVTLLLLIFLLHYSDDFRERLIWVAGTRQMSVTSSAMDEVGMRIARYLRMQLIVNLTYGALVAIGLALFGVPNALLFGVLGTLLRFVPYIGPWIAAVVPILLTAAVFPAWSRPVGVTVMFLTIELFTNMVMEPWLYGATSGMSTMGVVVATVFWAWIWGPVGMILAVPMTVCLVVIGKYVPQFAIFHHLFGTDEAVPDVARLYQRLLIGDNDAAQEIVTPRLKSESFAQTCDNLLLPVLCELKRDHSAGLVDMDQTRSVLRTLETVCPSQKVDADTPPRLLCVPAYNEIDEAAARLLTLASSGQRIPAEALSSHSLASEVAERAAETGTQVVCIVQVQPRVDTHARHIAKTVATRTQCQLVELCIQPGGDKPHSGSSRDKESQIRCESGFSELLEHLGELRTPQEAPVAA